VSHEAAREMRGDPSESTYRSWFQTANAKVNLAEAGTYNFYCDRPLHATMGMKGRSEVFAP